MKIIRTNHIVDEDGYYLALNYYCVTDITLICEDLYEEAKKFLATHSLENENIPINIPVNIYIYKTIEAANVKNYQTLTGEEYIRYVNNYILHYVDSIFLEYPMLDYLCEYIEINIATVKNKTVRTILEERDKACAQRLKEYNKAHILADYAI